MAMGAGYEIVNNKFLPSALYLDQHPSDIKSGTGEADLSGKTRKEPDSPARMQIHTFSSLSELQDVVNFNLGLSAKMSELGLSLAISANKQHRVDTRKLYYLLVLRAVDYSLLPCGKPPLNQSALETLSLLTPKVKEGTLRVAKKTLEVDKMSEDVAKKKAKQAEAAAEEKKAVRAEEDAKVKLDVLKNEAREHPTDKELNAKVLEAEIAFGKSQNDTREAKKTVENAKTAYENQQAKLKIAKEELAVLRLELAEAQRNAVQGKQRLHDEAKAVAQTKVKDAANRLRIAKQNLSGHQQAEAKDSWKFTEKEEEEIKQQKELKANIATADENLKRLKELLEATDDQLGKSDLPEARRLELQKQRDEYNQAYLKVVKEKERYKQELAANEMINSYLPEKIKELAKKRKERIEAESRVDEAQIEYMKADEAFKSFNTVPAPAELLREPGITKEKLAVFTKTFGTHYVNKVEYGRQLVVLMSVDRAQVSHSQSTEIKSDLTTPGDIVKLTTELSQQFKDVREDAIVDIRVVSDGLKPSVINTNLKTLADVQAAVAEFYKLENHTENPAPIGFYLEPYNVVFKTNGFPDSVLGEFDKEQNQTFKLLKLFRAKWSELLALYNERYQHRKEIYRGDLRLKNRIQQDPYQQRMEFLISLLRHEILVLKDRIGKIEQEIVLDSDTATKFQNEFQTTEKQNFKLIQKELSELIKYRLIFTAWHSVEKEGRRPDFKFPILQLPPLSMLAQLSHHGTVLFLLSATRAPVSPYNDERMDVSDLGDKNYGTEDDYKNFFGDGRSVDAQEVLQEWGNPDDHLTVTLFSAVKGFLGIGMVAEKERKVRSGKEQEVSIENEKLERPWFLEQESHAMKKFDNDGDDHCSFLVRAFVKL